MKSVCQSDTSALIEIVNSLLENQRPFFIYRLPNTADVMYAVCKEQSYCPADTSSYIIHTFDDKEIFLVPDENADRIESFHSNLPEETTFDQYSVAFAQIMGHIKRYGGKTVLSRIMHQPAPDDIPQFFNQLVAQNSEAYIFMFRSRQLGLWIGASPELLIESIEPGKIKTMALAGTRPATPGTPQDCPATDWDMKNIEEQQIVTHYITSTLTGLGCSTHLSPLLTHKAHNIEHLCNNITAEIPPLQSPLDIARTLTPTPALCGFPKEESKQKIIATERHNRMAYAGFTGPVMTDGRVNLYVTLRCAKIDGTQAAIFTGSGLTSDSDLHSEWEETKAKTCWYTSHIG